MCDPISHYIQQGVLVEAIKARQNHNEQAVAMILEANRQRRILRREQQLRSQQQQLLKLKYGTFQKHLYQQTPQPPFHMIVCDLHLLINMSGAGAAESK